MVTRRIILLTSVALEVLIEKERAKAIEPLINPEYHRMLISFVSILADTPQRLKSPGSLKK